MIRARSGQNCQFDDWAYSEVIYRSSDQDSDSGGDKTLQAGTEEALNGREVIELGHHCSIRMNVDDEVAYIGVNLKPSASHTDAKGGFLCLGETQRDVNTFDTLEIRLQYMYLMHYLALNTYTVLRKKI